MMRFLDNSLIPVKDMRNNMAHKEKCAQIKAVGRNSSMDCGGKCFAYTFNTDLLPNPKPSEPSPEPLTKRMKVNHQVMSSEPLEIPMELSAAAESSVSHEIITRPIMSTPAHQIRKLLDEVRSSETKAQRFASSGHFDNYKSCFKRRNELRMKDGINAGEDYSLHHPRLSNVTPYLRTLQNKDKFQHWSELKEKYIVKPLVNEGNRENLSPTISSETILPSFSSECHHIL